MIGRANFLYYLNLVLFGLCILIGIALVYRLQRENAKESEEITDADRIEEFERAYYSGDLDREEFEKLREALLLGAAEKPLPQEKEKLPTPKEWLDDSF